MSSEVEARLTAPESGDALVAGASRGLGLALATRLLDDASAHGSAGRVFASYRTSEIPESLLTLGEQYGGQLVPVPCELTDDESLAHLARHLGELSARLTLTINAAGILHETGVRPEKALGQVNRESLRRVFEVNAISPLMLARAVLPLVPRNGVSHFAALSAMVGSITDNQIGGWYGYRASKAALNQLLKTLAIEGRRTHPGLCVTAIHPGTTDTDLSRPFQGNVRPEKLYSPETSAQRILKVVLDGTPATSGRFMNWDGRPLPW